MWQTIIISACVLTVCLFNQSKSGKANNASIDFFWRLTVKVVSVELAPTERFSLKSTLTSCMLGNLHVFVVCWLFSKLKFSKNSFRSTMTLCTLHSFRNQSTLKLVACWVIFTRFMSSADYFQSQHFRTILSRKPSECQIAWIQIRPDILSGLIWVQTTCICENYQQRTSSV